MKRAAIAVGTLAVVLFLGLAAGYQILKQFYDPSEVTPLAVPASPSNAPDGSTAAEALARANPGFLYGRVTTHGGYTYEGRLRFGRSEEGFWGDYFNGTKRDNPWAAQVPPELLPTERVPLGIFGVQVLAWDSPPNLGRPFMTRFGDIARIEAEGFSDVRVTLKSGTEFVLDRMEAGDFDDGVRVWDTGHGVVAIAAGQISTIELLPVARLGDAPERLHGTVHTGAGDFSGFLQWDREQCVASDVLAGRTADGEMGLRFDEIRSIARHSPDSSQVTLLDGREIVLSGNRKVGRGNRGVYIDDSRYGRVLVSWNAFERVDFSPGDSGPAYGDFPPGSPLTGSVTTRSGDSLTGRLVFDLDESETTDTLDAPSQGVHYNLSFGLIASIALRDGDGSADSRARVRLYSGEELELERTGDLADGNGGMLIFVDGKEQPDYVPWTDVEQIDLDRPPAIYPPLGGG